jgi:hypothetical protein
MRMVRALVVFVAAFMGGAAGCGEEVEVPADAGGEARIYPDDYAARFVELRDCRQSIEHDLEFIRIYADEDTAAFYERCVVEGGGACDEPFPRGSLFVKEQHRDAGCSELLGVTAALRATEDEFPSGGGWHWQEVAADGTVTLSGDLPRCSTCHTTCESSYDRVCWVEE